MYFLFSCFHGVCMGWICYHWNVHCTVYETNLGSKGTLWKEDLVCGESHVHPRSYLVYTTLSSLKKQNKKNTALNWIQTHDLCDVDAVLYQLSYQASWELVILQVRNIPVNNA